MRKTKGLISILLIMSCVLCSSLMAESSGQENLDLHEAIKKGDIELAKRLIAEKKGIGVKDESGATPLMVAAEKGPLDVVSFLLDAGAEISAKDERAWRPLMFAAYGGQTDIAALLIERGAKIDVMTAYSRTPLALAAFKGHLETVEMLLDSGADINGGGEGGTALWHAAWNDQMSVAKLLIERGAKVNKKTAAGWSPLAIAINSGNTEIARLLIENGAGVNALAGKKWTPLMLAAHVGDFEIASLIVGKVRWIDALTPEKLTALMFAVERGHKDIAVLLMDNGADIFRKDNRNFTVLTLAALGGNLELVKILVDRGLNLNYKKNIFDVPLCAAFGHDHDEIGAYLYELGGKPQKYIGGDSIGDNLYATARSYMFAGQKCEDSNDMTAAGEYYSLAAKSFEKAIPQLQKTAEEYEKGPRVSLLASIVSLSAAVADTAVLIGTGSETGFLGPLYDPANRPQDIPPNMKKKMEYEERAKRCQEYLSKCKESLERLKK